MHIKEIVLDGFKSYAQRTQVGKFDPQFNAITGLNGSGKSNILDSICFVMGISNLSNVRATNLHDLVYKNGQAGVTKATVTITFDNSIKSQSPLGYQNESEIVVSRQVVVNGKNKYTINGLNATNQKVADLFQSVQLNVNTPHFLIMQGRVTKVLNMKPPEILAMIEEAAGTRMYESKREAAKKIIEKKEEKMRQINAVLKEEVLPKLTALKDERSAYMEFQNMSRKIEQYTKIEVAYQYYIAKQKVDNTVEDCRKQKLAIDSLKEDTEAANDAMEDLAVEAKKLEEEQSAEKNSVLKTLEGDWNEKRTVEARAQSNLEYSQKQLKDLEKKLTQLQNGVKTENNNLKKFAAQKEKLQEVYNTLSENKVAAEKGVEDAQKMIQAVSAGMYATETGAAASLHEQLNAAKTEKTRAETECEVLDKKLKQTVQDLNAKDKELKNARRSSSQDEQRMETLERECAQLREKLAAIGFDKERESTLIENQQKNRRMLTELRDTVEHIRGMQPGLNFEYSKPHPNFKDSQVKGVVAKLFDVKDKENFVALEVVGGGRMYNVVVDTAETASQLLEHGNLKKRWTFIPLDKVNAGYQTSENAIKRAKSIAGKENVHHALSLVDHEPQLSNAMKYIFGNSLVCNDNIKAKNVCFDKQVKTRVVTTAGDNFNPDGVLSGGSRPNRAPLLEVVSELKKAEFKYNELYQVVQKDDEELRRLSAKGQEFERLNQVYEAKCLELETLKVRSQQSSTGVLRQELDCLKNEKDRLSKSLEEYRTVLKASSGKISELESKIKDESGLKERETKKANASLKTAQQNLQKAVAAFDKHASELADIEAGIAESESEIASNEAEMETKSAEVEAAKQKMELAMTNLEGASGECSEVKQKYEEKKEQIKLANKLVEQKHKEIAKLSSKAASNTLEIQKLEYKLEATEKSGREARRKVDQLSSKYDWVERDKEFFGQPNDAYDFTKHDMNTLGSKLAKMQKDKETLGRRVNMRAMSMLEQAEKRFDELSKKQHTVLNDRKTLEKTMAELDKKKREALKKAVEKVNKDFGKIFNLLLDYAFAELRAPPGQSELDGLEIRCRFGDVWKESLTELSGGQRSLVALSLILAMLRFNPAPLYILDEVDAALDLSHTQNIGRLIATQFQNSQFIVVSLKDGLFNNANVLFRTAFVDGVSTVSRQGKRS